jgi:ABC-type branched-subunit amino acid transport system substrate-binding protein
MNVLIIFFLIIPLVGDLSLQATSFTTLTQAQEYAKIHPELVKPDNNDWLHPSFQSFHRKNKPNILQRLLMRLGISTKVWNDRAFENLLKNMIDRKNEFKGDFSERLNPEKGDTFVIWGDLLSAFHSLVRDLTFLQKKGIIDNELHISPHYYFIFDGNVIEGSPYILETLTLLLQLMKANPKQVIYTRGYNETEERWQNFEFMNELKLRFGEHTKRYKKLLQDLSKFFNSLPLALYLTQVVQKKVDVTVISSNEQISKRFDVQNLAALLQVKENRGFFYHNNQTIPPQKINLRAYITGEDRSISYHLTDGLTLIGAIQGAIRWMVFSSPTPRNQHLYKFYYDAFAQLHIADGMDQWTIALFNQKVPELKGFKKAAFYNLVTGHSIKAKKEGEDQKEDLFFGATMDLSKGASPIGKRVEEGLQLAFEKARTDAILPNIIPKLTTVNDEYTPQKTRTAIENFIEKDITMLLGSQGSATLESYLDLIEDEKILVLFPLTGAPEFRKPNLSHLVHYRGSYIREGEELIRYALKDLKARRIVIFYQDDAFGRGALEGARHALKEAGVTTFLEIPHERNVVNYAKQASQIIDFNPDTILFSTNTLAIRGLIRQMGVQYFIGKNLLGLSVYEDAFERFLKDKGLSFVLIRMVPDPAVSDLPIAKEYRKWANKYNLSYDKVAFEQFINANILFEILRKIEGPITKEKIIAAVENFKNYPFKGLTLTFNPKTRELSDTLWIDPGMGEWIKKSSWEEDKKGLSQLQEQLRFGSLMDLSKGIRAQGRAVKAGIELRLKQIPSNKDLPTISIVDDNYNPKITRQEIDKFIKQGITIIVCPVGSPTLESYLELVKQGKIMVLFPVTGAPIFRLPDLTNIVNLRASYTTEGELLAHYAIDQIKAKKIVLFYQNDAFGKGLLDAANAVLQAQGADYLAIAYERNTLNFKNQVQQINQYKPDTILFFSTTTAARNFLRQVGIQQVAQINMLGNSDMGEADFKQFMKETGIKFIYLNVVPNPVNSELAIVKKYREASEQQSIPLDPFSLEAYIGVDILLHVIQSLTGEPTKEKIIAGLTSFKDKDYKGLHLNFDPRNRTLLHTLWIDTGSSDWQPIDATKYSKTK